MILILCKLYHEKYELVEAYNELLFVIKLIELKLFLVAEDLRNRAIIVLNFIYYSTGINKIKL